MYRRTEVLMPTSTSRMRRWMIVSARNSSTPQAADVDDVHAFRVARVHAEGRHLRHQRGAALLHRQVEPRGAVLLRLVEEDAVHEGRLEGSRRARDEGDVPARDAAAETVVEADDVRRYPIWSSLGQHRTPSRPGRAVRTSV